MGKGKVPICRERRGEKVGTHFRSLLGVGQGSQVWEGGFTLDQRKKA